MRKKIFENNSNLFNDGYHIIGDFDFCIRISLDWQIECCQLPIAFNRIHGNNESIINYDMQTLEFEKWIETTIIKKSISQDQFVKFKNIIKFRKAKGFCKNNISKAFKIFLELPISFSKLKLFFIIVLNFLYKLILKR